MSCRHLLLLCCVLLIAGCETSSSEEIVAPTSIDFESADRLLDPVGAEPTDETWHIHRIDEYKFGHRWTRVWQLEDGDVHRLVVDRLEIPRFGAISRQTLRYATLESAEGALRQFAVQSQFDRQRTKRLGVVDEGTLHEQRTSGKNRERVESAWATSSFGFFAVEDTLLKKPPKSGETRTVTLLTPLQNEVTIARLFALGDGKRVQSRDSSGRVTGTYRLAEDGSVISFRDALLGVETSLSDELSANAPNRTLEFDLAALASVPCKIANDNWASATKFRCRVTHPSLNPADLFSNCAYQRIRTLDANTAEIDVQMPRLELSPKRQTPADTPGTADVQPNRWLQSNDPAVEAFALAAVADAYQPTRIAQRLHANTFRTIEKSLLGKQFGSATEALESRRGDCTEHAVLLAAALRNRNIPARVALGLVYSESSESFVYHMWTETWLEDRWVPLDAMAIDNVPHALRLKLVSSDMTNMTELGLISPYLSTVRGLRIEQL